MGESRVDILHLLEDLRDAYAESIEESRPARRSRPDHTPRRRWSWRIVSSSARSGSQYSRSACLPRICSRASSSSSVARSRPMALPTKARVSTCGKQQVEVATKLRPAVQDARLAADQQRRNLELAKGGQRPVDWSWDQGNLRARGTQPTGTGSRPTGLPVTWHTTPFARLRPGWRCGRSAGVATDGAG